MHMNFCVGANACAVDQHDHEYAGGERTVRLPRARFGRGIGRGSDLNLG
jgi:hypothetical protein